MASAEQQGTELLAAAGVVVGGDRPHDIRVHDDRLWARVLRDRELGLGEAYQDGWWDADRLDEFLVRVLTADLRTSVRSSPSLVWNVARARIVNRQTTRRAERNAQAHYDIGNDLYLRMLGDEMVYSCAHWKDADDLADAQTAKLDLVCRKLGLGPGMRVSAVTSLVETRRAKSSTLTPERTASAILAPMPVTFCTSRNSRRSRSVRKP